MGLESWMGERDPGARMAVVVTVLSLVNHHPGECCSAELPALCGTACPGQQMTFC